MIVASLNVRWMLRCCFWVSIALVPKYAAAQIVDHQQMSWYHVSISHRFTEKLGATTFYDWRKEGFGESWQQSLLRVSLDYTHASNSKFSMGYDWVETFRYGKQPIQYPFFEHRLFQQAILNNRIQRLRISHRYRLEERFLEQKTANDEGVFSRSDYELRYRGRYRLKLKIPLAKKTKDPQLFFSVFDEVFLNFGNGTRNHFFDQNWWGAGFSYKLSPASSLSVGYMNQFIAKSDLTHIESNHLLTFGFSFEVGYFRVEWGF